MTKYECPECGNSFTASQWNSVEKVHDWRVCPACESNISKDQLTKYKCPECNNSATASQWNSATAKQFGKTILPIDDVSGITDASFICPKCDLESRGEDILELCGDLSRPSWDEYFIQLAVDVAKRSTCLRRQVGAIIVDQDNHILATGYNGAPAELEHCTDRGYCVRQKAQIPSGQRHELCRAVHAEMNAIIQAAKHGTKVDGGSIYLTHTPCIMCAKALINAGIQRIVYAGKYPDVDAIDMLSKAGVKLEGYYA